MTARHMNQINELKINSLVLFSVNVDSQRHPLLALVIGNNMSHNFLRLKVIWSTNQFYRAGDFANVGSWNLAIIQDFGRDA